jgi:hypothetical protein
LKGTKFDWSFPNTSLNESVYFVLFIILLGCLPLNE